jgi:hypothetical protein
MAATNAQVTRIDALGEFRASLIVFRATAQRALDEAVGTVSRARQWVRHEQRMHWEHEIRRRQKKLDEAQQEMMRARLSSLQDRTDAQQNAVTKARNALREAEEKLRAVKRWDREFDLVALPLVKQLDGMRGALEHEMPKALAFLANAQHALDVYSEKQAAPTEAPVSEPSVELSEGNTAP